MFGLFAVALAASLFAQEPAPSRTGSVVGQVVDALGEPVPLADVWVTKGVDGETIGRTKADGSGRFAIGRLPQGQNLILHATADGKTEALEHVGSSLTATAWLRLWDAGTVAGRVVDANGTAIAGAEVIASYDDARVFGFDYGRSTTTDKDGRYRLARVPLGTIDVRAIAPGCVLGSARVSLRDHVQQDLVLQQGEGVRLTVSVVGVEPSQLRGARVSLEGVRGLPQRLRGGTLDAEGMWTRSGFPDRDYAIYVDDGVHTFQPRRHSSKRDEAREVVFKAFLPATVRLHGRLLDLEGKSLPEQALILWGGNGGGAIRVVTGPDGSFETQSPLAPGERFLARLTRSDWILAQHKDERHSGPHVWGWHEGVVDSQESIELRAEPEVRVQGRVLSRDGEPVRFVRVDLEHARVNRTPVWMAFAESQPTDREGRFEFRGLRAFGDDVRVKVDGRSGVGESEPFWLQVGEDIRDLELRLVPPAIIEGVARDPLGAPIPGARVQLRNWDFATGESKDGHVAEVLTDRHGRYRHLGVAAGGHWLEQRFDGHEVATRTDPFEVTPGQRVQRDL